jgi:1A family penicillin-binding protein
MDMLLAKILATALALSQVMTAPGSPKTQFDRNQDQQEVAQLLHAGCIHMLKALDVENIDFDDLMSTAMIDPQAVGKKEAFRGINFSDLQTIYRQYCKDEKVPRPVVDIGEVIDFYNETAANLPDYNRLKGLKLPGATVVLDRMGGRFAQMTQQNRPRIWVSLADIPPHVRSAFIAAEDERFYQHKGIDERGIVRAFVNNLAGSGRPQGGSTITQQLVKNLLVGNAVTYERKIREMILASRVELTLSKDEILELYLNSIYLGRDSWGIELAARNYFGKRAKELTLEEGALLAALTKGPNYFDPVRHPKRAQQRLKYVLGRMHANGFLPGETAAHTSPPLPALVAYQPLRRDGGFYFVDQVKREAKAVAGIDANAGDSYVIHSTVDPRLQRAVERALQEGLWRYERDFGRAEFRAPEANLASAIEQIEASKSRDSDGRPPWRQALARARLPLYDVHWRPAVVLQKPTGRSGEAWRVGLADGRILPLSIGKRSAQRRLAVYDVVLVHIADGRGKAGARAELRVRPQVQGAVVVLENKTGRVLAVTGGFSYPLSQLDRATQSVRQPGSAIKPLSYLAALGNGLQPNTLLEDEPITLPPIGKGRARGQDYWTPKSYDGRSEGLVTLRHALEDSRNLATVHLLEGGIADTPEASLDRLCQLGRETELYRECQRYYPFMLGAQPVRPIDLAAFYATIANEGVHPQPHVIDSIEQNGQVLYRDDPSSSVTAKSVDHAAFYQLKSMMQGVLARGTARAIAGLSPYVAGKTGTSEDENDAWFAGFTNDVTVAVWLGYDNADGKRRTLGGGATGGSVAAPIFAQVIESVWADGVAPKTVLAPPSPEAQRQLACGSRGSESGGRHRRSKSFDDCLRVDEKGSVIDATHRLVSRRSVNAYAERRREHENALSLEPLSSWDRRERPFIWQGYPWSNVPQRGFDDSGRDPFWPRDLRRGNPNSDWREEPDDRRREPPGWRSRSARPGFWSGPFD